MRAHSVVTSGREDGTPLSAVEMLGDDDVGATVERDGLVQAVGSESVELIDGEEIATVPIQVGATNHLLFIWLQARTSGLEPLARQIAESISRRE